MAVVGKDTGRVARAVTTQLNSLLNVYGTIETLADVGLIFGITPTTPRKEAAMAKRAVADTLGVSLRAVQSWFPSSTTTREHHAPKPETLQRLVAAARARARQAVHRDIQQRGLRADLSGRLLDPSGNERDIDKDLIIPGDLPEMEALLNAWELGDRGAEVNAFDEAFRTAWDEGRGSMAGFEIVDIYALRLTLR